MKGVPAYGGAVNGELCTPTGAALLKYFVDRFDSMPTMTVNAIGYGMGKKDFDRANCVRAMFGEKAFKADTDSVLELSVNIDDMTAEEIAYATDILLDGGALDIYTQPIGMKKCRPGTKVSVLCRPDDEEKMIGLLFKHTSTLGVRKISFDRYVMNREVVETDTVYGKVRRKVSSGYGVEKEKYEYDDIARIAKENDLSIEEVIKRINKN